MVNHACLYSWPSSFYESTDTYHDKKSIVRNTLPCIHFGETQRRMHRLNKISRLAQFRRTIFYLSIIGIILYIIGTSRNRYYDQNDSHFILDSKRYAAPYNDYIDINGSFLPYAGYKILQFVKNPLPQDFVELNAYLDEQYELKKYFRLVPTSSYHITLTSLQDKTSYNNKELTMLKQEQELLDQDDTEITCTAQALSIVDKLEIRMEIDLQTSQIKEYQKRWIETFPKLVVHQHTSFYITLAYQYRKIPDKQIFKQIEQVLKEWQSFPVDVPLDPIEICVYNNIANYQPVVPDLISA